MDPIRKELNRANGWFNTASLAAGTANRVYALAKAKLAYSISVAGSDWIYDDLHLWLLGMVTDQRVRSLRAKTTYEENGISYIGESDGMPHTLQLFSDDERRHIVQLEGNRVEVSMTRPDLTANNWERIRNPRDMERVTFTTRTAAGRDAVKRLIEGMIAEKETRGKKPEFWVLDRWGDWGRRDDLPPRSLESVVLKTGQLEGIVQDLERFLGSEAEYNRRSMPYHRAYLLEGPPGTGKTSIARALCSHFRLNCYWLPLGDVSKDANLVNLVGRLTPHSVLILEDIDVFHAATQRDDNTANKASLSGLLNTLDGLATPHGLISFLTTNSSGSLDEALLRPGRIDVREFFDVADTDQADHLFEAFYGQAPRSPLDGACGMSPSAIVETFKQRMHTPEVVEELYSVSVSR